MTLITLFSLFFSSAHFYPVYLFLSLIFLFNFSSIYFLEPFSVLSWLVVDEISLFMVYMTVVILFVSYLVSLNFNSTNSVSVTLSFMFYFCYLVFTIDDIFLLYVFYEASLLPILYIIAKWGSYPERSLSGLMLFVYTAVLSFPFLLVFFSQYSVDMEYEVGSSWSCQTLADEIYFNLPSTLLIFFIFGVKLPIYGLHYWLPMAHVEAPTFGSMILAGILLKLGGVGLYRFTEHAIFSTYLEPFLFSYCFIGMITATIICTFQSDFKRLIAYSSVSHMMAVPFLVMAHSFVSNKALLIIMLFHGLSSPILFMLVGVIYNFSGTRQIAGIRGLLILSPLITLFLILSFLFTVSAPPFPSFFGEVLFMISTYHFSVLLIGLYFIFLLLSIVYNLNWLSAIVFSSSSYYVRHSAPLSFLSFYVLSLMFVSAFLLLTLVSYMW